MTAGRPHPVDVDVRWSRRGDTTELELDVADPDRVDPAHVTAAIDLVATIAARPEVAGSALQLAADHPADSDHALPAAVAAALGFAPVRTLLQLRRPLPVPADHPARAVDPVPGLRPFAPGPDDGAWVRVNNRAFADHPDQGAETAETLAQRTTEPWFDPAGFLVADDPAHPGEMLGFCWTKVHPPTDTDPELGEIYVIGVDPSAHGRGLGAAFVLAGLDHLAAAGPATAMLYVEADNGAARRLYDRLGFTVHRRRVVYAP